MLNHVPGNPGIPVLPRSPVNYIGVNEKNA